MLTVPTSLMTNSKFLICLILNNKKKNFDEITNFNNLLDNT